MSLFIKAAFFLLKIIICLCDVITLPAWYFYYNPRQRLKQSRRLKAVPHIYDGVTSYRDVDRPSLTTSPAADCVTVDELLLRAAQNYGPNLCLGTRDCLREEDELQPDGKVFKKVVLGEYSWLNYEQVFQRMSNLGSGLQALGQKPRHNLLIFAETRADWMISAQACFKFNFPLVTLYSTLGDEAIVHGINETEVTHIITSAGLLEKFKHLLARLPTVKHIIYMDQGARADLSGFPGHVGVHSMTSVERIGAQPDNMKIHATKPVRHDVAVIMYTSGSTGLPKGVLITHGNLMAGMSGQLDRIPSIGVGDTYIAYLPLAHVLELTAEISCLSQGVRLGYSTPLTLTDQSSKIKRGSLGDASVLRPTLMAAVPSIMDRINKSVWDKVNSSGPLGRELFNFCYNYKQKWLSNGYDTPLINRVIFKKICLLLGGRVRLVLSGGAPLSEDSQKFMNTCLCCPVGQGYGLTETCGAGSIHEATDFSTGRVGAPLCCNEIMLRNWEEGNYLTTDFPFPRGEIFIGGGNVTLGYYKNPQKTQEDFLEFNGQRWFATGDIGQIHDDGCLQVIDRKKDLVKLQAGEYVSLTKVETCLVACPLVDTVCIYADSRKVYTVGLIVPNPKKLNDLGASLGFDTSDLTSLVARPQIVEAVLQAIQKQSKLGGLEKFEIPQKIVVCPELWTPDTGLVTESLKLRRKNIQDRYQHEINRMYA